jgi:hypothetical protein
MTTLRHLALALSLAMLAGCGSSANPAPGTTPDAAATPDSGLAPDSGGPGPDGSGLVPLVDWVSDLVENFAPTAAPDTVEDKRIMDTEDPGAFDTLLMAQP